VFAILFIISAIWVIISSLPARKILSPGFYQQALADANIYQRLPQAIALQMTHYLSPEGVGSDSGIPLVVLSEKEWEAILVDLIDPAWLESQSDRIIDQFFEVLLVSPDPANTPIDINVSQVKKNFAGQAGVQAIIRIIESQPPCSVDQLVGLVQVGLGMENSLQSILCRPPEFILSEINPLIEAFLATAAAKIPDEIQIYIPFSQFDNLTSGTSDAAIPGDIPNSVQTLRQVNMVATWSPLLPLLFLLLLTVVVVRSLRDFMAWWGGVLFTAGMVSLVLAAAFPPAMDWGITNYSPFNFAELVNFPEFFVLMGVTDIIAELVNQLQLSIILPAGVMTTIGFALLLGVFLLSRIPPGVADQEIQTPKVVN
jgi:hypothetical protein